MSSPLVSVAMATHNGEAHLREQVRSILEQEVEDLELVISDDDSGDATRSICRDLASTDPRVRIVPRAAARVGFVRNFERALVATRGRYIAFADQDDIWDPDKLSRLLAALRAAPERDMAFSDLRVVDGDARPIAPSFIRHQRLSPRSGKPFRALLYRNFVTGCTALITDRLKSVAVPFPEGCLFHDWWIAVVAAARGGIVYMDRPTASYRQHGANVQGATGSGIGRVHKVISHAQEGAGEGTDQLDRVRSYRQREDAILTSAARATDLDVVQSDLDAFVRRRDLDVAARIRLLGTWMRYVVRPEPTEILAATTRILFPDLATWFIRRLRH